MKHLLGQALPTRYAPRWIVALVDMGVASVAVLIGVLVRFEFAVPAHEWVVWWRFLPFFAAVRMGVAAAFNLEAGILRHTGTEDARRVFWAVSTGTAAFIALNAVRFAAIDGRFFIPFSVLAVEWLGTLVGLIGLRLGVKWLYLQTFRATGEQVHVAIFGAGEAGLIAKRALDRELSSSAAMHVVAFIDDDPNKVGKKLEGVDILSSAQARRFYRTGGVDRLIISAQQLDSRRRRRLVDQALAHGIRVLDVPPVQDWINGELTARQIRELRIEDLLGRAPIELDRSHVAEAIRGKRIAVTGAAGSIGSELVRQILVHHPAAVLAIDQAETPMHDLQLELNKLGVSDRVNAQLGDVRDREQVLATFAEFRPDVVFHAAAYKHVPLMERQPWQAFETNVVGTRNVLEAAQAAATRTFVLVSTDKAVNPTSVMGATKRAAERLVQHMAPEHGTRVITTRFGNVLGSNGSVIPLFRRQIAAGGPVTVTDEEVTRFFMTIPEAVQLVLEAGAMGEGGEVFVFDMGERVRIFDLATKMIRLAGKEPDRDIAIEITGLRPGEKLHEELLLQAEDHLPTHHPKIMRAAHTSAPDAHWLTGVEALERRRGDHAGALAFLEETVPEFAKNRITAANFEA